MAETILFGLAGKILSTLAPYALDQISLSWYAKRELKKLENKISTIRNVLLSAQELQNNNPAVKDWLRRLKIILEEADDLFDDFAFEALRREIILNKSKKKKVLSFFTSSNPVIFSYSLGCNIKDIREKLEDISSEIRDFGFVVQTLEKPIIKRNEGTISFVNTQNVIGREDDKRTLLQLLLSSSNERNVNIIPIVGMGGLGKTTLAQMIFNDEIVKKHFPKRLWVCVSDDFNVERLTRDILKAAEVNVDENLGMEQLQIRLQRELRDKKFVLVLDDVWNDNPVKWGRLADLLMTGARGSMVLVTTRDTKVASIVGTMETYVLKGLSEDDCLFIFLKWAFKDGEETKHPDLIEIGREIVKKCGGVPLAARTLGALLLTETCPHKWSSVRDSAIWAQVQAEDDIIPILKLSYDQMPSSLKECFAYCSLFDKDEWISKERLMYHWIAHELIQPHSDKIEELEDVCETYFGELLRRSFLEYTDDKCLYFKMHDLVHDLAQYVAGGESLIVKGKNIQVDSDRADRVRHVLLHRDSEIPSSIIKEKKLRTIMKEETFLFIFEESMPIDKGISSCRSLRVADIKTCIIAPKDTKKWKQLRYLRCHDPSESLCDLLNLQFLEVIATNKRATDCIGNLKRLRVLIICFAPDVECLPGGIQNLVSLRKLVISQSPKLKALGAGLRNITSLVHLKIDRCLGLEFSNDDFQGLTSLKYLKLSHLLSLKSLGAGLRNMTSLLHLEIVKCHFLELSNDDFQGLTSLKYLKLSRLFRLQTLGAGLRNMTSLVHLEIDRCLGLEFSNDDFQGLTSLKYLKLSHLPGLKQLPRGLEDVSVTLNHLVLRDCYNMSLTEQVISNQLESLEVLEIHDCDMITSLLQGMQHLHKLSRLEISDWSFNDCNLLLERYQLTGKNWHKIAHVPHIYINGTNIKSTASTDSG